MHTSRHIILHILQYMHVLVHLRIVIYVARIAQAFSRCGVLHNVFNSNSKSEEPSHYCSEKCMHKLITVVSDVMSCGAAPLVS